MQETDEQSAEPYDVKLDAWNRKNHGLLDIQFHIDLLTAVTVYLRVLVDLMYKSNSILS